MFVQRSCPEIASDLNSGGIYIFLFVCQLRSQFMCSHGDFDGVLNVLLVSCVSGLRRGVRKRVLPHSMQNQGTRSNSSTETKSIKLFFKTQHLPQKSYQLSALLSVCLSVSLSRRLCLSLSPSLSPSLSLSLSLSLYCSLIGGIDPKGRSLRRTGT